MYSIIVFSPLIASILSGLFGNILGKKGAQTITCVGMLVTMSFSLLALYEVGFLGNVCYIKLSSWIESGLFVANWGLIFDSLTVSMLLVVNSVSTLVHFYSCGYMDTDRHVPRFMSYLSLFTFFMLVLVTADNLLQLFVGWEGVGICSYLLVNFWFTRVQANKSALKAIVVNRIGDVGLLLGIFMLFKFFCSIEFSILFPLIPVFCNKYIIIFSQKFNIITLTCLLLFIGSVGKSAQVGLHTWLPDAMEGPTPVSALIHAATMVTAGVFLIIRCSPLFEYSEVALNIITVVGAVTALFGATTAIVQNDIKRVIAYSTCSQLLWFYNSFASSVTSYLLAM